jgi:hypothetical protein
MADSPTPPDGVNSRITLAVLNANLLYLTNEVRALRIELCTRLEDHEKRMRDVERWNQTSMERWRVHEDDHEDLNRKNWAADIIGSAAAFVGAVFLGKP